MDPLAALLDFEAPEETQPEPKPKEKKKRIPPAVAKKIQAKLAEEARQQLIRSRQEYLSKTKKRVQEEWERDRAKAQVYEAEFVTKMKKLKFSYEKLSEIDRFWTEYHQEIRKIRNWAQYLACERLPDPSSVPQLNSYIFVWSEMEPCDQMSECIRKTEEVIKLLDGIEEVIGSGNTPRKYVYELSNLIDVFVSYNSSSDRKSAILGSNRVDVRAMHLPLRNEIRDLLQDNIDRATFNLFSRIEKDMLPINVTASKYTANCPYFVMSLWAELFTPIPSSREKDTRQPLKVAFEETEITATIPVSLLDIHKVIRTMWLSYDHWSDRCRSYECPAYPAYYEQNLFELFMSEHDIKTEILNYREALERTMKNKISHLPPDPSLSQEILVWDSEPQRALSDEIIFREWEEEDNLGRQMKAVLKKFEVNLRERSFLGNFLLLEVLHLPPQPKYLRFKHSVTLREEPPKLHLVDFYVKHPPPELEDLEYDEDEEEAESDYPKKENDLEEEKKKLVTVQLKPCKSVCWFEPPRLANWDPKNKYWSTEDVHDVIYNEEEETITFKTGRLGVMGLHVSRFCNLPYQDYVFEGSKEGGANFYLKTPKVELSFKIRPSSPADDAYSWNGYRNILQRENDVVAQEKEVCLETVEGARIRDLDSILGTYHPPSKLMKALKKLGIDVFPSPDAASYMENIRPENFVVESNIYQVWGLFSGSFRFKFSKFNQVTERSSVVFQAQEVYENHQVDYCLIQTALCKSYILNITEDTEKYSAKRADYTETDIDLYTLICKNCTRNAKRMSDATSFLLVQTVREFLQLVRPISYSYV